MEDNVATVHHCLTSSVAVEARVSPWSEPGDSKDGFRVNKPSTKWIQLGFFESVFEVHFFLETRCNHWDFTVWWRETLQGWGRAMAKSSAFPMGSNETFHRKIQTRDALQHKSYAQLANYVYIYCKKNKYVCIYIIIFYALHVLYKHHPSHPIPHGTSGLIVKCISTKGTSSRLTARLAASKGGVILLPWYARKWTMNENVGFFLWKKMNIFPIVVLVLHSFTRTQLWISISCISIYIYIHIVY